MNRIAKRVLVGYGGFAVVNYALAYAAARAGAQPGQNRLLDFNGKLLQFNILARLLPLPLAAPASMPAIPDGATITVQPTGTTTTFGPS